MRKIEINHRGRLRRRMGVVVDGRPITDFMRRHNIIDGNQAARTLGSHVVFAVILLLGTLIRVWSDTNDGNTTVFAMVLATGVIFAVSLFNKFIIDLFNDLNNKWKIINYCVPAVICLFGLLVFRVPVEPIDLVIFPALILIADLVMYAIRKGTG